MRIKEEYQITWSLVFHASVKYQKKLQNIRINSVCTKEIILRNRIGGELAFGRYQISFLISHYFNIILFNLLKMTRSTFEPRVNAI